MSLLSAAYVCAYKLMSEPKQVIFRCVYSYASEYFTSTSSTDELRPDPSLSASFVIAKECAQIVAYDALSHKYYPFEASACSKRSQIRKQFIYF